MTKVIIDKKLQGPVPKRLYDVFVLPKNKTTSKTLIAVLLMESQKKAETYAKVYKDRGKILVSPTLKSDYPPNQRHLLKNL